MNDIKEYLALCGRVKKYVTKRQDHEHVSIRKISRAMGLRQNAVLDIAEDMELCINIGWITSGGWTVEESIGNYTIENLNP